MSRLRIFENVTGNSTYKNNYLILEHTVLHASDPRPSHVRIDFSLSTDIVMNKHTISIIFIITPLVSNVIHTIDSVAHIDTCLLIASRLHHKTGTFRIPGAETKQSCVGLIKRMVLEGFTLSDRVFLVNFSK